MGPIKLTFDVTDALPSDVTEGVRIVIGAWLFLPSDLKTLGGRPVTMVLLNGGSYDKRYYHVEIPGHPRYSAADHLAERGNVVLVCDHLGVSDSSRLPVQRKATRHIAARANHAAVSQFYVRLASGDLHPELPPVRDFVRIGGGHSMGGMQTIIQQAAHRTYQGVMILGYTAQGVHITTGGKKVRAADSLPPEGADVPDYPSGDRSTMHENFHWRDVPAAVIAADDAIAAPVPSMIGLDSIRTGIVADEAAQIDVPIYLCLGEQDVSPDPYAEPACFRRSNDFTLHILPRSAHCQNFAGTRHLMWDRMHDWAHTVNF